LYEMLSGNPPFYNDNVNVMYEKILYAAPKFPPSISDSAKDIISKLLEKDPSRRLGAGGSVEIKKHLFFKSIDWDKIYAKEIEPPFKPALTVS